MNERCSKLVREQSQQASALQVLSEEMCRVQDRINEQHRRIELTTQELDTKRKNLDLKLSEILEQQAKNESLKNDTVSIRDQDQNISK